jgi:hypothetical protein
LDAATKTAETLLRESFRPKIVSALGDIGLVPKNLVEVVSREKMVEELLDLIVERGFLTMGEVRDAISRNHVKQSDCAGPADFFRGDGVLRLNRRLGVALDGVYERGDFYQRWIQRFSLAAFGTSLGRFLTKYLAIPYGVAFVILVVIEHLAHFVTRKKDVYTPTLNDGTLPLWTDSRAALSCGRLGRVETMRTNLEAGLLRFVSLVLQPSVCRAVF